MWGWKFINKMGQHWQDKDWMKIDDVTPYNLSHRKQRGLLSCVGEYHFRRYCGSTNTSSTWAIYQAGKRKKLYWKLHPQYVTWIEIGKIHI